MQTPHDDTAAVTAPGTTRWPLHTAAIIKKENTGEFNSTEGTELPRHGCSALLAIERQRRPPRHLAQFFFQTGACNALLDASDAQTK